jgi:uncharacterized membrane protein
VPLVVHTLSLPLSFDHGVLVREVCVCASCTSAAHCPQPFDLLVSFAWVVGLWCLLTICVALHDAHITFASACRAIHGI